MSCHANACPKDLIAVVSDVKSNVGSPNVEVNHQHLSCAVHPLSQIGCVLSLNTPSVLSKPIQPVLAPNMSSQATLSLTPMPQVQDTNLTVSTNGLTSTRTILFMGRKSKLITSSQQIRT